MAAHITECFSKNSKHVKKKARLDAFPLASNILCEGIFVRAFGFSNINL